MIEADVRHRLMQLARRSSGQVVADVPLCTDRGAWPEGTADHRIHAILVHDADSDELIDADDVDDLGSLVAGADVSLVMAAGKANRPLLGHLLAGTELFSRSHPDHGRLSQIVVVEPDAPERNIAWVYDHHGVEVVVLDG